MVKCVSILGSTGSIGRQTLDIIDNLNIPVAALTAEGYCCCLYGSDLRLLSRVLEREFSFHQECRPGPDDGVPEDLLLDRLTLRVTGCQRLSSKLIVKGEAALSLLYRTKEQLLDLNAQLNKIRKK